MQKFFDGSLSKPKQTSPHSDSDLLKSSDSSSSKIKSVSRPDDTNQASKEYSEENQNTEKSKKPSPRELTSSAITLRKLSAGKDHKSLTKEHDTTEETGSKLPRNASPRRELKHNKEFSSSDPSDTSGVLSKHPRHKISLGETKKEIGTSDSDNISSTKPVARKKSSDVKKTNSSELSETTTPTRSRHSSPRHDLKKSGKELPSPKEHTKDEKQDNLSANNPKIKVNYNEGSTSSEKEREPEDVFPLHLKTIIAERTDIVFHRKTYAYFDSSLQRQTKPRSIYTTRLNFNDYFKYITDDLNDLQRKKIELIESLVAILEPAYAEKRRSVKDYNKFCRELLDIFLSCMGTSLDTCAQNDWITSMPDFGKPPTEQIALFWKSACTFEIKKLEEEPQNVYNKLIDELIETMETCFIKAIQLNTFKEQKLSRPSEETELCCVTWDYINSHCDSHFIAGRCLEGFRNFYNEACNGLACEFIFVPHLWDFIKQTLDKETRHHSPYHETLKKLDKLFLSLPAFEDFAPESKSYIKSVLHF